MLPPASLLNWQKHFSEVLQEPSKGNCHKGFLIYQEAYWGRLEIFLRRYYPSLPKLLGDEFWINEIAYPFIAKNPVQNWALEEWTMGLFDWLLATEKESLSALLIPLAHLERLQIEVFLSPSLPAPSLEKLHCIFFTQQPHIRFFLCSYPLLSYRTALLKDSPLPSLDKIEEQWVALSLGETGEVILGQIDAEEKLFLEICSGKTLREALEYISRQEPTLYRLLDSKIQEWTARWIKYNWMGEKHDNL